MPTGKYVLAIDLGTSGCKAALVSVHGRVVAWCFHAVETRILPGGGAEQDPDDWWNALLGSCKELIDRAVVPREEIVALCCSTQGEGTVAVDAQGRHLMNAILWMDSRGAGHLRKITRGPIEVSGYHAYKLFRWIRLTGGAPSTTGKDPASHMLFIKHQYPDVYQRTHKFLNVLDYLNLRLTGRSVATYDSILTSWVTDNRDVENVVYSDSLLRGCGIDRDKFPEIVKCTEVIGNLDKEVSRSPGFDPRRSGGSRRHRQYGGGDRLRRGGGLSGASVHRDLVVAGSPCPVQEDRPRKLHRLDSLCHTRPLPDACDADHGRRQPDLLA